MNINNTQIILASASPRRRELMAQAGLECTIITSNIEEVINSKVPSKVVAELSAQKGENVYSRLLSDINASTEHSLLKPNYQKKGLLIVSADTIVSVDDHILGKPSNYSEAYEMISALQGRVHSVFTGVTLLSLNLQTRMETKKTFTEETKVCLYPMSKEEIDSYILTRDPFDKAGAYGIQGPFAVYVKGIEGDYNNVVGLPIGRLYQEIKSIPD